MPTLVVHCVDHVAHNGGGGRHLPRTATVKHHVVYGVAAATVRDQVLSRPSVLAIMRRLFAGAFVLLGVRLALTEQQ